MIELKNIGITFNKNTPDENTALKNINLSINKGDFITVIGSNGAGKSTLLRIIAGIDQDFSGSVKLGAGVSVGYFSQDSAEKINGSETILERLENNAPLELIPKLRDMLGAFLFRGDDVYKSIDVLSGGEKSRIALLELLLRPVNLLVLDEPTNHLDMHSKDVLLDALKDFGGTVIFVSHDRGFIESLATRVLELHPGTFRVFPGDYKYYMQRLEDEAAGTVGASSFGGGTAGAEVTAGTRSSLEKASGTEKDISSAVKLSWEEQKKANAERRKIEREVQNLEEQIEAAEAKKAELENQMANPAVYSDGVKSREVQKKINDISLELEKLNSAWEEAAEKLD